MWVAVGIIQFLFVAHNCLAAQHHKDQGVHCFHHKCHHEEACNITNVRGQINGDCITVHGPGAAHNLQIHYGCPQNLADGQNCVCNTQACIDNFHLVSVAPNAARKGPNDLQCGHHHCTNNQVCLHTIDHAGHLHSACHLWDDIPKHSTQGCTVLPTEQHPCYCWINACNTNLYNHMLQQTHGVHTNTFQCADQMCSPGQYCTIKTGKHNDLHLKCLDQIEHNFQNCLPNLFHHAGGCYCQTKACVDHALISIIHGLHIAGIVCGGHDLHTVCKHGEVCEINHERNGMFTGVCSAGLYTTECHHAPLVGHSCHCSDQDCVYGKFTALQHTTTIAPSVTVMPTAHATPIVTTHMPIVTTNAPIVTTNMPSVTGTINPGAVTTAHSTNAVNGTANQVMTTMASTCVNVEDNLFTCVMYDIQYNLCSSTSTTLYSIASKRCPKYCGLCSVNGTVPSLAAITTAPTTLIPPQPVCMDHDARCVKYQQHICNTVESYVVATCAKTCNKCAAYLASLTATAIPVQGTTI